MNAIAHETIPRMGRNRAHPRAEISVRGARKEFWAYHQGMVTKTAERCVNVFTDVTLHVSAGEFIAILGQSGCGKTTLLRCVGGLESLSRGVIEVGGDPVRQPRDGTAVVFQSAALFPWMTVEQNVQQAFSMRRGSRKLSEEQKQRIASCIALVGLTEARTFYPHQLSGGMQQRVGIARALVGDPDTLLMDEPFGALDAQTRSVMQEEILRLYDRLGFTAVFITHDLEEALILADRVIVMTGTPSTVTLEVPVPWSRPRSIEAARSDRRFAELRRELWQHLRKDSATRGPGSAARGPGSQDRQGSTDEAEPRAWRGES